MSEKSPVHFPDALGYDSHDEYYKRDAGDAGIASSRNEDAAVAARQKFEQEKAGESVRLLMKELLHRLQAVEMHMQPAARTHNLHQLLNTKTTVSLFLELLQSSGFNGSLAELKNDSKAGKLYNSVIDIMLEAEKF